MELKRTRPAKQLIATSASVSAMPVRCSSPAPAVIDVDELDSKQSSDDDCVVSSGRDFPHIKKQRKRTY